MSNEFDDLERRLGSATGDLRTQINSTEIPDFKPRRDGLRVVAVAAAVIVFAFFGWSILNDQPNSLDTVDTPDSEDGSPAPDTPDGDDDSSDNDAIEEGVDEGVEDDVEPNQQDAPVSDPNDVPSPSADELIVGFDTTPPVDAREPGALGEVRPDPAYGSSVRRIVDATPDQPAAVGSAFVSPENADGTLALIMRNDESWDVVDRATLESTLLANVDRRSEPHWDPTDPNRLRHFPEETADRRLQLLASTVDGSTETLVDLTDRVREVFPNAAFFETGFGHDPAGGSVYDWAVGDDQGNIVGFVSYDLEQNVILGSAPIGPDGIGEFSSVRISPSGTHVIVGYDENSVLLDVELTMPRVLDQRDRGGALVSMPNAGDALITVDLQSDPPTGGWIYWTDLESGEINLLFELFGGANTSVSFSASDGQPGWAVMSSFTCRDLGAWSCDKVTAVHLASGTLVNLAHTYLCAPASTAVPAASLSPSFERIYFNSDSGSCGDPIEVRELTVPPDVFDLG